MEELEIAKYILPLINVIPEYIRKGLSVLSVIKSIMNTFGVFISKNTEEDIINKEKTQDIAGLIEIIKQLAEGKNVVKIKQEIQNNQGNNAAINYGEQKTINITLKDNAIIEEELSEMAINILKEAIKDEFGQISVYDKIGGTFEVNTNCKSFFATLDETIKLRQIKEALLQLENKKMIEPKNNNRKKFEVTLKGHEEAKHYT